MQLIPLELIRNNRDSGRKLKRVKHPHRKSKDVITTRNQQTQQTFSSTSQFSLSSVKAFTNHIHYFCILLAFFK